MYFKRSLFSGPRMNFDPVFCRFLGFAAHDRRYVQNFPPPQLSVRFAQFFIQGLQFFVCFKFGMPGKKAVLSFAYR